MAGGTCGAGAAALADGRAAHLGGGLHHAFANHGEGFCPLNDVAVGNETYVWNTPGAKFPEGSYSVRVEGYRKNQAQHYSSHQEKIYVNR